MMVWTPAHFWALALLLKDDYQSVGIPMLPVVKGKRVTKNQIMIYAIVLFLVSLLPYILSYSGLFYLSSALILNIYFCYLSFRLLRSDDSKHSGFAPKLFKFSILYLYLMFSSLVVDSLF